MGGVKAFLFCFLFSVAWGTVTDVPSLNGPVPVVPYSQGMKKRTSDFVHPGLWHTHDDLETIRSGVLKGIEPWASTYQGFSNDSFSQSSYMMQGPKAIISRGSTTNSSSFQADARAAYQNAIMWYVTKDQAHWNRSTTILDAWGSNLSNIIGTDRSLLVGLDGDMFTNAAEIMRWEGGWVEQGARWQGGAGFSIQLYWLFARQSIIIGQANYGVASIKGLLSFAVYLDDVALYNYALHAYKYDLCAGLEANIDSATGQSSEAGRDQAHAQLGVGWLGLASRVANSQGYDLFQYANKLIFKGAEYLAKYNLNETVEYDARFYRCEAVLVNGPWANISAFNRGLRYPVWDLLHYEAARRGIAVPWTDQAKATVDQAGGEGRRTDNDMPGWGRLLWASNSNATAGGGHSGGNAMSM